jgi:hypothetical protein
VKEKNVKDGNMKLVREHINEKFEEHSDPIRDLGIGGINLEDEWNAMRKEFKQKKVSDSIFYLWQQRLEELFLGRKVTGNFSVGNLDSYGAVKKNITTDKVVRIELEGGKDFSLVCIKQGSWENHPDDEGEWVNPDEVWYVVELVKNPGKIWIT